MRKKKSESGSMWEIGEREERRGRGRGRDGWGKGGGLVRISSSAGIERAADKKVAAARFWHKRYC